MPDNNEINELIEDANTLEEVETRKYNTRGPTRYIKQALIRIFRMSPEERTAYQPKNGWEEAAMAHFNRCILEIGTGTAAFNALRESIGESISRQKAEPEKPKTALESIIDDLPRAVRAAKTVN